MGGSANTQMVKIHIKRGDESSFLFETTTEIQIEDLIAQLVEIFNGILKVQRLCQGWSCNMVEQYIL